MQLGSNVTNFPLTTILGLDLSMSENGRVWSKTILTAPQYDASVHLKIPRARNTGTILGEAREFKPWSKCF